jgi:hypothetical protein
LTSIILDEKYLKLNKNIYKFTSTATFFSKLLVFQNTKSKVIICGGGGTEEKSITITTNFDDPNIKKLKFCLPILNYQLKNEDPPLPKTLQRDTIQLSHMSFTTSVT